MIRIEDGIVKNKQCSRGGKGTELDVGRGRSAASGSCRGKSHLYKSPGSRRVAQSWGTRSRVLAGHINTSLRNSEVPTLQASTADLWWWTSLESLFLLRTRKLDVVIIVGHNSF